MPRDIIILGCTEDKPTSRYVTTRNKKSLRTQGRLEKVKFNKFLNSSGRHSPWRNDLFQSNSELFFGVILFGAMRPCGVLVEKVLIDRINSLESSRA